jgi:CheY-like chemotaxis protein
MVTDVRMPRMDGWTLAEQARELRPDLPVVYITGYSDELRPVQGATVLAKPFRPANLLAAAGRLLAA